MDHHRFDRGGLHRLAEGGEIGLAVFGRPPHPRALVEDLDRFAAELLAALDRVRQAAAGGNMRSDQHDQAKTLRFRFAPSPTGALHIGGARTALYNWLAARHDGGELVLRIEDTDRERSTAENVEQILDAMRWLELDWDEGPVSQAERRRSPRGGAGAAARVRRRLPRRRHRQGRRGLEGRARRRPRLPRHARPRSPGAAVRLRVPDEGETVVEDLIRGPVAFPNPSYDDFVIARGDGSVLYNFAVAVDDAEMGITEVVRGDDHLSNTPKQLLVLEALGSSRRATPTCRCCTAPTARSSPSATAPPRCRSCARPATCRRRSATTWRCSAGGPTTTRR